MCAGLEAIGVELVMVGGHGMRHPVVVRPGDGVADEHRQRIRREERAGNVDAALLAGRIGETGWRRRGWRDPSRQRHAHSSHGRIDAIGSALI
jgi:hypothetical protein